MERDGGGTVVECSRSCRIEVRAAHLERFVFGAQLLLQLGLLVGDERRGAGAGLPLGWHHRHRAGLRHRRFNGLFENVCTEIVYHALPEFCKNLDLTHLVIRY